MKKKFLILILTFTLLPISISNISAKQKGDLCLAPNGILIEAYDELNSKYNCSSPYRKLIKLKNVNEEKQISEKVNITICEGKRDYEKGSFLIKTSELVNCPKKYTRQQFCKRVKEGYNKSFAGQTKRIIHLICLNNNKVNQNTQVVEDNSSPNIIVSEEFESNNQLMAEITGSINDESEIASLTIDGYEISLKKSNFKKEFFVKPKGQDVEIVAIDIHGNKSSKIVSLKRQQEVIQQVKLDSLNPTKIQSNVSANKVALIIGVENYKNTFSALYAENDALYFNDFANTTLGVPKENIKLLTNDEADQNNTIKALIKWLPKVVVEDKTELYLFFSGHGLASPDGEDLFLLPSDGDPEILEYSSLMRNEIFNNIAKLNPKSVTVFLDTCYSGETRSDDMLIASAKPIFIEAKEQDIPVNFNIFSASSNNEIATIYDEAEHGLFSYYMMKGLEGEADSNNDRAITNGELHAFINKNVSRQANQTPQLNGDPEQVLVKW